MNPNAKTIHLCATLSLVAALAGCTAYGSTIGKVTDRAGQPEGPAKVSYETHGGTTAKLTVAMPDGEIFAGTALELSRHTDPHLGFSFGSGRKEKPGLLVDSGGREWDGTIEAVLNDSRGRTMTCRLREKRPGLGFEGGAIGICRVGDGREVAIEF